MMLMGTSRNRSQSPHFSLFVGKNTACRLGFAAFALGLGVVACATADGDLQGKSSAACPIRPTVRPPGAGTSPCPEDPRKTENLLEVRWPVLAQSRGALMRRLLGPGTNIVSHRKRLVIYNLSLPHHLPYLRQELERDVAKTLADMGLRSREHAQNASATSEDGSERQNIFAGNWHVAPVKDDVDLEQKLQTVETQSMELQLYGTPDGYRAAGDHYYPVLPEQSDGAPLSLEAPLQMQVTVQCSERTSSTERREVGRSSTHDGSGAPLRYKRCPLKRVDGATHYPIVRKEDGELRERHYLHTQWEFAGKCIDILAPGRHERIDPELL